MFKSTVRRIVNTQVCREKATYFVNTYTYNVTVPFFELMVLVCIPPLTTQHQRSCESPFFLKRNHSAHTHYCCNDKHISLLAKMIIIYAILIRNASPFAHQLGIAFGTRKPFDTRKQVSLNKLSYNDPSIKVWWRFIVHCVQDVPYRRYAPSM